MPGVSYQEILFLFAVISHLTWTCELCILKDSTHRASRSPKCIEHSYAYRFPVCVKILVVPSTASSVTTASSSTLPSSSLVPFRLHFVFTTVTNSPARRHYRHQAWYHFDFTPSALPSPVLEPFRLHFIVLVTKSVTSLLTPADIALIRKIRIRGHFHLHSPTVSKLNYFIMLLFTPWKMEY